MNMELSKQEFDAILKLSPEKRYLYFIKRVCDWEEMWTIYEVLKKTSKRNWKNIEDFALY